jgi:hypothetical protein
MTGLAPDLDKYVMPEPMSGCWLWLGAVDWDNYGVAQDRALKRSARAHRLVYETLVAPIPKGKMLLHSCDNPCCVNPDHLRIGTHQDNVDDCKAKGRHSHGVRHPGCKLKTEQVLEIRKAEGSQRKIAARFGVSQTLVMFIKSRKLWKHLEDSL